MATIRAGVSRAELTDLHAAGVRGIRFNFVKRLVDPKPDDYYRGLVDLVAEVRLARRRVLRSRRPGRALGAVHQPSLTRVVDHMGRPDVSQPVDGRTRPSSCGC